MKRIIIHWTAGTHKASDLDRQHYHFIVQGDGSIVDGIHKPEANLNTADGDYAAHTLNANTGAIGVAVAAMAGAVERPFNAGAYPITAAQLAALSGLCARLCDQYGIEINRDTVLTHAEVQPTLGIKQRGKWDITWLPGDQSVSDPVQVGDRIRAMIRKPVAQKIPSETKTPSGTKAPSWLGVLFAIGAAIAAWLKMKGFY